MPLVEVRVDAAAGLCASACCRRPPSLTSSVHVSVGLNTFIKKNRCHVMHARRAAETGGLGPIASRARRKARQKALRRRSPRFTDSDLPTGSLPLPMRCCSCCRYLLSRVCGFVFTVAIRFSPGFVKNCGFCSLYKTSALVCVLPTELLHPVYTLCKDFVYPATQSKL